MFRTFLKKSTMDGKEYFDIDDKVFNELKKLNMNFLASNLILLDMDDEAKTVVTRYLDKMD